MYWRPWLGGNRISCFPDSEHIWLTFPQASGLLRHLSPHDHRRSTREGQLKANISERFPELELPGRTKSGKSATNFHRAPWHEVGFGPCPIWSALIRESTQAALHPRSCKPFPDQKGSMVVAACLFWYHCKRYEHCTKALGRIMPRGPWTGYQLHGGRVRQPHVRCHGNTAISIIGSHSGLDWSP